MSNLVSSLWITLIGIILIFVAIVVLWGAMELLVRVTTPKDKEAEVEEGSETSAVPVIASDRKRKAAIAAVAVALALQKSSASLSTAPESSELSAWQVAPMRK